MNITDLKVNKLSRQLNDIPNQPYITEKAKQSDLQALQTQVSSVTSGSPKGTYSTVSALTTAFPSGNSNIYVVTADGGWYFWNGSAWTKGGTYQSTGIATGGVKPNNIAKTYNLIDQTTANYVQGMRIAGADANNKVLFAAQADQFYYKQVINTIQSKAFLNVLRSNIVGQVLCVADSTDTYLYMVNNTTLNSMVTTQTQNWLKVNGIIGSANPTYEIDIDKLRTAYPTAYTIYFGFLLADKDTVYINGKNVVSLSDYEWLNPNQSASTLVIPNDFVTESNLVPDLRNKINSGGSVEFILPSKLVALSNVETNIYYNNIVRYLDTNKAQMLRTTTLVNALKYARHVPSDSTASDMSANINLYLKDTLNINLSKTLAIKNVKTTDGSGLTKKCLFIGDSLTAAGTYTQELLNLFNSDALKIELLGTLGTAPNKHEGRGGWAAYNYATNVIDMTSSDTNVFWNPSTSKFDFAYYMAQQGYTSVDNVFICLGTNDTIRGGGSDDTILSSYNTMINSIKAYNSNVKVFLWLPPTRALFGTQIKRSIDDSLRVNKLLISNFDNREIEKIYLVPVYFNIDPENDYNSTTIAVSSRNTATIKEPSDTIHPSTIGYYKIADVIRAYIKYSAIV